MRTPALWLTLLLVVAAIAPASALAAADAGDASSPSALGDSAAILQLSDEPDAVPPRTTVEISLESDRSAHWRVETHYRLETENETRAFETVAAQYEAGETDAGPGVVLFESLKDRASDSTGRPMAIENVTYHSSLDETADRGTLAVTFRWTNFLRRGDNETLVLDDVFTLPTAESDEQRTWLSIFDSGQEVVVRPPDGYTVTGTSIPVQQRESAIVLTEPSDFEGESGALRVTYTAIGAAGGFPIGLLAGGGFAAIALLVAGAWALRTREEAGTGLPWGAATASEDGTTSGGRDAASTPSGADGDVLPKGRNDGATAASGPDAAAAVGGSGPSAAVSADGPDGDGESDPDVDLSLLSDEERVEHLLAQNGGRMKQATIVDETGWSDAKVSQLLSAMADADRVDKLRLGRENLISLPDGDDDDLGHAPGGNGVASDED